MGEATVAQILQAGGGWYLYILFGLAGGFLSALLGIGGGVVMVPLLVLVAAFPQKLSQGTALGFMVGTCLVGAWRYHYVTEGVRLNIWVILLLTAGGIIGALIGGWTAGKLNQAWLQRLFAIVMVIAAYKMMMRSFEAPRQFQPEAGASPTPTEGERSEEVP